MSNSRKIPAIIAVTLGFAALVGAQVDVALRPAAPIPNDPLVQLDQTHAPNGQLVYMVPVSIPGPPTRTPSDLVVISTGTSAAKNVRRLVPPFAEAAFGPQILPDMDSKEAASTTSVLVKIGWPYEELSTYKLYRWNWQTNDLKAGPSQSLNFRSVFPSPSGRYTAFITGGNATGEDWGQPRTQPLALHIYDWENRKTIDIARKPTSTDVSWTPQETLLFSSLNENSQSQKDDRGKVFSLPVNVTNAVFEFDPQKDTDSLLIPNAYTPVVSPDGKQVAFIGWNLPSENDQKFATPEQEKENKRALLAFSFGATPAPQLWMISRGSSAKTLLLDKSPIFYCWQPDGKAIVACNQTYVGENEGNYVNRGSILQVDILSKKSIEIARLDAFDARPTSEDWAKKRFVFEGWDSTKNQIVLSKLDLIGVDENGVFLLKNTFSVIDMKSRECVDFAVFKHSVEDLLGVDWKPYSVIGVNHLKESQVN